MQSSLPKVLHPICGLPLVEHVGNAMRGMGVEKPVLVVGNGAEGIVEQLGDRYRYVEQEEQLGTGHALQAALPMLPDEGVLVVAPGDAPLISAEALGNLVAEQAATCAACVLAVFELENPTGYGRVIRDTAWSPIRVVEELEADEETKRIREVNSSFYCFSISAVKRHLPSLRNLNSKGEYYLTDLVGILAEAGEKIGAVMFRDPDLLVGVNDRWQLAKAESALRMRILEKHALAGVTIVDPSSTYVDVRTIIGKDTVIQPQTHLEGTTEIGSECEIGPNTRVSASKIGDGSKVFFSHLNRAIVGEGCRVGPYANLRPHTVIGARTRVGNYVEIKNALIGQDVSLAHLTYIGDATVGDRTNIGAGTITCNFDGKNKHRTEIGSDVFVGSNSTLVAPLRIDAGAFIAAGSVITKNVGADALALGRSHQTNKEGWAKRWREQRQSHPSE